MIYSVAVLLLPFKQLTKTQFSHTMRLGPRISGLVTDGNTKICCCGFILALFQSITANEIDYEQYPRVSS